MTKKTRNLCHVCGGPVIDRRVTADEPYHYTGAGLSNVYLDGIYIRRCPECDTNNPVISRLGELHGLISKTLLRKHTRLTGEEVRFLRKNAGISASAFAKLLRIVPSHLSRIENGHYEGFSPSTDKLVRMSIALNEKYGLAFLNRLAEELSDEPEEIAETAEPVFRLRGNRWLAPAA